MATETTKSATPTECPRCGHDRLDQVYASPVAGVREIHHCRQCMYS